MREKGRESYILILNTLIIFISKYIFIIKCGKNNKILLLLINFLQK